MSHAPRPFGLHSYGGSLTDDDMAAVRRLSSRVSNLRAQYGVDSLRMMRALPDGGHVWVTQMGGLFRCVTHKPREEEEEREDSIVATDHIPMLFSARVTESVVEAGEGVRLRLTNMCRRRLAGYSQNQQAAENVPEEMRLHRFRIEYGYLFTEFQPPASGQLFYSQYTLQRPTWYSGAMAEVMQIVGGWGRQDLDKLPASPWEQAQMAIPANVRAAIRAELGENTLLPAYTGKPPENGQFQYDYKHARSNAVCFGEGGQPWLVRVTNAGVFAMPLPVVPATGTKAFRTWIESVGDEEILAILDRFGAIPSGEPMPEREAFEAWRRAGVIVKLCDTADFYEHLGYSSACGWSFNASGNEGFNTCYDYDDAGVAQGFAYAMRLAFGQVSSGGKLPQTFYQAQDDEAARRMDAYLSALYAQLGEDDESNAVRYKLRRVTGEEILSRYGRNAAAEFEYWKNREMEPIAGCSGAVRRTYQGYLFHPAIFKRQPQVKFPEPVMGGCVSFDFSTLDGRRDVNVRCDTILFGYYVGDDLKVVKYFHDTREFQRTEESDYENCMQVGTWFRTEYLSPSGLAGNFHTTDFDERRELTGQVKHTQIVGRDCGFDSKPFFAFDTTNSKTGTMWRNRYYTHETTTTQTDSSTLAVGVCVPFFCRNAVLHAVRLRTSYGYGSESLARFSVRDPTSYRYWTFHPDFAWSGNLPPEYRKGQPTPKDGNPVWVEMEQYNQAPCSDFADYGSWVDGMPADYSWLIHPVANVWNHSGGGGAPPVQEYSHTTPPSIKEEGKLQVGILDDDGALVHADVPHGWYFEASPDDNGQVFYRDGCRVVFGNARYASVSEEGADGLRRRWGFSRLADHRNAHNFMGVIHE